MTSFDSVDTLYRSLIQQCVELPTPNKEMELSIFQSLLRDQKYNLIFEALEKFRFNGLLECMAMESGDLKVCQHLHSRKKLYMPIAMLAAIKNGKLETVIWLIDNGCGLEAYMFNQAVYYNHFEIAKLLFSKNCPYIKQHIWSDAIRSRNIEMTIWLTGCLYSVDRNICEKCCVSGNLEFLKIFRSWPRKFLWDRKRCLEIATNLGHTEMVNWIRANPIPYQWEHDNDPYY